MALGSCSMLGPLLSLRPSLLSKVPSLALQIHPFPRTLSCSNSSALSSIRKPWASRLDPSLLGDAKTSGPEETGAEDGGGGDP